MHPVLALMTGLAFLAGLTLLGHSLHSLVSRIPTEDTATAYEATVWALVGLLVTGFAGARMAGESNPLERMAAGLATLTALVRRR